ncbi:unnamed protein product [Diatraea saccharalis]|uniref:Uncharacterized protein n=1 Tax=Diatraea saccharalis TaxID=40085 RepID=A0A9N9RF66_9NEOP|nr:unnamed protein product [Diatraea saccharalis]
MEAVVSGDASEEARAERKRRQRQAQEEFRQRQLLKQKAGLDEKQELHKTGNSFDKLLMEIPTQDIVIEETGATAGEQTTAKRSSPLPEGNAVKRRASFINRLDIVETD